MAGLIGFGSVPAGATVNSSTVQRPPLGSSSAPRGGVAGGVAAVSDPYATTIGAQAPVIQGTHPGDAGRAEGRAAAAHEMLEAGLPAMTLAEKNALTGEVAAGRQNAQVLGALSQLFGSLGSGGGSGVNWGAAAAHPQANRPVLRGPGNMPARTVPSGTAGEQAKGAMMFQTMMDQVKPFQSGILDDGGGRDLLGLLAL